MKGIFLDRWKNIMANTPHFVKNKTLIPVNKMNSEQEGVASSGSITKSKNLKNKIRERILVAMSGGVDSSVAAALLKEQGYDVIGMTMQVWDYSQKNEGNGTCCSSIDVDDARNVADKLKIPFYVLNCEEKFKSHVIDNFLSEYLKGKTPLPCVNCNTYLKFDHLFKKMKELNCDYLATGHYALIQKDEKGQEILITSADSGKDQTYFLFTLTPDRLKYLKFPIGHLKKEKVRQLAKQYNLSVFKKKDSTGICFVGKEGYSNFIKSQVKDDCLQKGFIRRFPSGEILGSHTGIHNFTYGQRRGLGITNKEPLYVIKIEAQTKDVWVGREEYLFCYLAQIVKFNSISPIQKKERVRVKVRYQHEGAWANVKDINGDRIVFEFEEPQRALTPGQAAVAYRNSQLLGGGWII